jgi:hypothetical protein
VSSNLATEEDTGGLGGEDLLELRKYIAVALASGISALDFDPESSSAQSLMKNANDAIAELDEMLKQRHPATRAASAAGGRSRRGRNAAGDLRAIIGGGGVSPLAGLETSFFDDGYDVPLGKVLRAGGAALVAVEEGDYVLQGAGGSSEPPNLYFTHVTGGQLELVNFGLLVRERYGSAETQAFLDGKADATIGYQWIFSCPYSPEPGLETSVRIPLSGSAVIRCELVHLLAAQNFGPLFRLWTQLNGSLEGLFSMREFQI